MNEQLPFVDSIEESSIRLKSVLNENVSNCSSPSFPQNFTNHTLSLSKVHSSKQNVMVENVI